MYEGLPYVQPVLNLGGGCYLELLIELGRCGANKGVRVTRKDLVTLGVKILHFDTQLVATCYLLALLIVAMDRFIAVLP